MLSRQHIGSNARRRGARPHRRYLPGRRAQSTRRQLRAAAQRFLVISAGFSEDYREVIRAGEIYTKRFGEDPEIEYWIAGAFDCLGDVRQAKQHYDRTIQITPEDSVTYQYLIPGEFFLRIGETKKGREILRKGLGIMEWKLAATPDNDVLRTNGLGGYYAALGDEASVRRLETYLLQKDPVFQGELPGLAGAYLRLGDREHALELMRRAVALEVPSLGLLEPTCSAHDPLASIRDEPIYRQFISQGKRRREEARARY